ncbi:hypothetical protein EDD22DRAFT_953404 [Suillus occidentalis]|nr:hypothetical protein EDD22DRAFT_953404 [Suillus occidentalis]
MSTVYSYEAAYRDDDMIGRVTKALKIPMKEMRPEVVASLSRSAASYCPIRNSMPLILAAGMHLKRICEKRGGSPQVLQRWTFKVSPVSPIALAPPVPPNGDREEACPNEIKLNIEPDRSAISRMDSNSDAS